MSRINPIYHSQTSPTPQQDLKTMSYNYPAK
nr:MAG TPA: hypothetical protein [Caudoviricetes sp.]